MHVIASAALASVAAWAWHVARRERAHRVVATWATAMAVAQLARAAQPGSTVVAVAAASLGSLGLLAATAHVFARRRSGLPALGASALLVLAHPSVPAAARDLVLAGAWIVAAAAIWLLVGHAVRRGARPRLAHLVVMIFGAAAVVRATMPAETTQATAPLLAAAVAALGAHGWWSGWVVRPRAAAILHGEEESGERSGVGRGAVVVRGDDRVGDLVDVAEAIRRRRARPESRRGGLGGP